MKKNIKGFTLVELLAVVVILGIIMTIAGTSLISTRKKANQSEVVSIYNTIKKIGPDVYLKEGENNKCYTAAWLKENGYLKSEVSNPAKPEDTCAAYLIIDKLKDDMFEAYVECEGLDTVPSGKTEPPSCRRDSNGK